MRLNTLGIALCLSLTSSFATAQSPQYYPEFLGTFMPGRISETGQIIGNDTVGGNQRGFSVVIGQPIEHLPLPAGMISSIAIDVNDNGVIVGAAGSSYSPEFQGRAVAWDPDGAGGYTVRFLGALPGQSISRAAAVNNLGDIVGYSSDGTYRYPVLFTGSGVTNLSSTGIFDPADINDQRVVVDHSFTVKRLDLETMVAEDLGVPPGSYLATTAAVINEAGQVGGLAILTTSSDCDRVAARYTDGIGWQVFSTCGRFNSVSDMNEQGDVVMPLNVAPYVRLEGRGTYLIEDLIVNDVGHWYVSNLSGLTMNSAGWIVVFGTNQVTGQSGSLLLRPDNPAEIEETDGSGSLAALELSSSPNPFLGTTEIRYELSRLAPVNLVVLDAAGRSVRRLVETKTEGTGVHQLRWDGLDDEGAALASGVYFLRLESSSEARVSRITLIK